MCQPQSCHILLTMQCCSIVDVLCAQEEAAGEQNLVPSDAGPAATDIEQLMDILGLGKPQVGSFRCGAKVAAPADRLVFTQ